MNPKEQVALQKMTDDFDQHVKEFNEWRDQHFLLHLATTINFICILIFIWSRILLPS